MLGCICFEMTQKQNEFSLVTYILFSAPPSLSCGFVLFANFFKKKLQRVTSIWCKEKLWQAVKDHSNLKIQKSRKMPCPYQLCPISPIQKSIWKLKLKNSNNPTQVVLGKELQKACSESWQASGAGFCSFGKKPTHTLKHLWQKQANEQAASHVQCQTSGSKCNVFAALANPWWQEFERIFLFSRPHKSDITFQSWRIA